MDIDYLREYAVLDGDRLDSIWVEIDRLRAENAALRSDLAAAKQVIANIVESEVEPNREDAERYRWLRCNPTWVGYDDDFRPDELDAAIDAFRKDGPN